MKKAVSLLLLIATVLATNAQELKPEYAAVYMLDEITLQPIEGVLAIVNNRDVGESDEDGRLVFSRYVRNISPTLIFFKDGYALDSITLPYVPDTFYLHPLSGVLEEAVVTNKKVELLLRSGTEQVVDYGFVDDNILVASYSGYNGKGAKLFVLDDIGDTISMKKLRVSPRSLYCSCVGQYYLVSYDAIYPIYIDLNKKRISLGKRKPLSTFEALKQCILYTDSFYYYKQVDKKKLWVSFYLSRKGDTTRVPFREVWQKDELYASLEQRRRVFKFLASGDRKNAMRLATAICLLDKNSFKRINVPLFKKGDSLLIFDLNKHLIHYYSLSGSKYAEHPMQLDQGDIMRTLIMQDKLTKGFYMLNERHKAQELRKISLSDGLPVEGVIRLEKPFAKNIKIKGGNIYYLWHDGNGSTTQLYIQRNSIK